MQSSDQRTTRDWQVIGLASLGHGLCHVGELAYSGVLVAVCQQFQLRPDQGTALAVPGLVLFGLGAVVAGVCTDRWGARGVLVIYFLGLGLASLAVAVARTWWLLAAALTLLGAAISLYHPAGLAMLAGRCRARGQAMGIHGVAGSIGVAAGPAIGLYMAGWGYWQGAYLVVGGVALAAGLAMLWLGPNRAASAGSTVSGASSGRPAGSGPAWAGLWLLFAAMVMGGFNYRCLTTALPAYLALRERGGQGEAVGGTRAAPTSRLLPGSAADGAARLRAVPAIRPHPRSIGADRRGGAGRSAVAIFIIMALGGLGQLAGGHTADRLRPTVLYTLLIAATVPLALVLAVADLSWAVPAAAVLALFMFAEQPVENTIVAQATTAENRSTAYGIKFILSFGIGALGMQAVGVMWERFGTLTPVFVLFACCAAVMAMFAFCFGRRLSWPAPVSGVESAAGASVPR